MKNPNFSLAPTVIGFGENNLKERIISIMKFKKPTTLTIVLSAFLVIGIGTTAAFAAAPKPTEPDTVPDPELTVTTSEPILENNLTDNNFESSEPVESAPSEPETKPPVNIVETLGNTELIPLLPLKWENGLETPPEGKYITFRKFDENGNEMMRYFPGSYEADYLGKNSELLGDDYNWYGFTFLAGHGLARDFLPKDLKDPENPKSEFIEVIFPPDNVITYSSKEEVLDLNSMCAVSYDYNEDGTVTVYYFNFGDEPIDYNDTRPKETKHYTHEKVVDGGIIVW